MVRPVAQDLFDSIMLDCWPRPAAICDFGIETQAHYEALHRIIREGEVTIEQLDEALGDGPKLTKLVNGCPSNPHKGIVFVTDYDFMKDDETA